MSISLLVGILCAGLLAQPQPQDELAWIVDLLDSPDWSVREAFTTKLQRDREISLREIEGLLRSDGISAEARLRLATVAKQRFIRSERAAVGMGPLNDPAEGYGVQVGRLQDGFDAQRVLRRGDRILSAQGRLVRDWDAFRALILSNDPGDAFDVVVVRDGETLNLSFQLGRYSTLENRDAAIDPSLMEQAWQIRMADLEGDAERHGDVANTGYATEPLWRQAKIVAQSNWPDQGREAARAMRRGSTRDEGGIEAAGQQAAFDWGRLERVRMEGFGGRDEGRVAIEAQLQIYREYLQQQTTQLETLQRRLAEPNLDERTRRAIASQIQQKAASISHIRRWIAEAERELGDGG